MTLAFLEIVLIYMWTKKKSKNKNKSKQKNKRELIKKADFSLNRSQL